MQAFLTTPLPRGDVACMRLTRNTRGIAGKLFPEFYLHFDTEGVRPMVMCAVRKLRPGAVKYIIATDMLALYQKQEYAPLRWSRFVLCCWRQAV
jgi:hypothetical protein